ncbi:MAG: excinuclease ABC subunit UvrC [Alphaproteobacteria bacterium]|nr:excinuclease ABC subunit UvrC [Alphaproteobacteria bacterium]
MSPADKPLVPDLAALPEEAAPGKALVRGVEVVKEQLKLLPPKPGVYRMLGHDGEVLYVGKAKSLKARVSQYAQGRVHANRIARMITLVAAMEFIVTKTETEALLLEANMIKRLRPRFNVIMRDDKSFPFIAIRTDHPAAALQKHRGAKSFKGLFFGPFASASAVNRTLNTLQKAFLLRTCSDSVFSSRTRPCMLYQIKRCAGPCVNLVKSEEYLGLVEDAAQFLKGKSAALQDRLAEDMRQAAEKLEFERAARLRNRIRALAAIRASQGVNPQTFDEADLFAIHMEGGFSCIQVFFFRGGQNWGNRAYFPKHEAELPLAEVLESFMAQFYDDKEPPALILASAETTGAALLEAAFSLKAGRRVDIHCPQRGEKKDIMDQAVLNAREALARRMAEQGSIAKLLDGVAEAFGLTAPPERIEVYDNSHIQGTNAVGAMIVAGPEGFLKNQYRKFAIRPGELTPGDDYAMMRQVVQRRFARLGAPLSASVGGRGGLPAFQDDTAPLEAPCSALIEQAQPHARAPSKSASRASSKAAEGGVDFSKETDDEAALKDDKFGAWPDLVVIDGGEGQLKAALEAIAGLGLAGRTTVIGVAKGPDRDAGRERFFIQGRAPFRLPENSPVLYYLQRLRDEAHRFAIGAHRQKRKADLTKNPLDEIQGVGPARKRALLARFGSAKAVGRAAIAELLDVEGVNAELARRIYDHFHPDA